MTKEQLETMFGIKFFDYEVTMFNQLLKAYEEGRRVIIKQSRQIRHKVGDCFLLYTAIKERNNDSKK